MKGENRNISQIVLQIAEELLADADAARDMASKAVEKAEQTLVDARDTLDTLKGKANSDVCILCHSVSGIWRFLKIWSHHRDGLLFAIDFVNLSNLQIFNDPSSHFNSSTLKSVCHGNNS